MAKISIIVTAYNAQKTLPRCLDSILSQTLTDFEVILVNDGSNDKTSSVCGEYEKKDSRIRFYNREHTGRSASLNYALSMVSGEFLSFVDADDAIAEDFLEILYKNIIREEADISLIGYVEMLDEKVLNAMDRHKKEKNVFLEIFKNYQGFLTNKMYKCSIVRNGNLSFEKDLSMCEDLLFTFQYLLLTNKAAYSNYNKSIKYIDPKSLSRGINKSWFGILLAYHIIVSDLLSPTADAKDLVFYNYVIAVYESKMRCRIMKLNFEDICKEYHVDINEVKKMYRYLLRSDNLTAKDKIKMILFAKFNNVSRAIKFRGVRYA